MQGQDLGSFAQSAPNSFIKSVGPSAPTSEIGSDQEKSLEEKEVQVIEIDEPTTPLTPVTPEVDPKITAAIAAIEAKEHYYNLINDKNLPKEQQFTNDTKKL